MYNTLALEFLNEDLKAKLVTEHPGFYEWFVTWLDTEEEEAASMEGLFKEKVSNVLHSYHIVLISYLPNLDRLKYSFPILPYEFWENDDRSS